MTDQPYHHGNLRGALLERAMETIEDAGVEGLSLRQLARDLNVSHGAPAKHFRDKQALIDALALAGFESMNHLIVTAAQPGADHRQRFHAVAQAYVEFAVAHPALLTVMYSTKHHPDSSTELRTTGEQGIHVAQALVTEAQLAGALAPGNPETLAMVCFVSLHGAALLAAGKHMGGMAVDDVVRATTDTLWAGMAAGVPASQTAAAQASAATQASAPRA